MSLAVVLVEPAGPLNVGSVARLCANFQVGELRLVAPRCDHLGAEARLMAVHAEAVLERARSFPTLAAAVADCARVVATSGRVEPEGVPLSGPEEALGWLQPALLDPASQGALVFGREDRGLTNQELLQAGRVLRLNSAEAYASLNLSHAVAICLHGLQRPLPAPADTAEPCPRGELEAALADAEELLLEVGFLHPHTAEARLGKVRALLQRAQVRSPEVALLRGMVRQLRWATQRRSP
ncbi:MAG: RNA methyltransferase [Vulcanococcus sp.]